MIERLGSDIPTAGFEEGALTDLLPLTEAPMRLQLAVSIPFIYSYLMK